MENVRIIIYLLFDAISNCMSFLGEKICHLKIDKSYGCFEKCNVLSEKS